MGEQKWRDSEPRFFTLQFNKIYIFDKYMQSND